ncbi:MAG TPA: endonuclease/exonuclease/phosphatase family protein [Thermoanaerobaculia bacterium]|nr:endonuclease/exonuclease/phosphatase family protein [Thermoanaerobaculia bacterium]
MVSSRSTASCQWQGATVVAALPILALAALAALAALTASPAAAASPSEPGDPLAVVSFNIRYGTAEDGENHWTRRREMLFALLRELDADLVGLQEALDFQIAEILAAMPRYAAVGVGRDDGGGAGELSAILFDRERLWVASSGTFWFSDTPAVPGSRSWGNTIPRIATWARFVDRDGSAFWHYNVHLDHQSQPSRVRSTALLADRIAARAPAGEPVLVTGDFNAGEDNAAMTTLLGQAGAASVAAEPPFLDTFRVRHPDAVGVGTFSGFDPSRTAGPKIDYVLVQPGAEVLDAAILRWNREGRTPSDHFPVSARVRLGPAALHQADP